MAQASVKLVTKKKTETHTRDWVIENVDLFFQQDTRNLELVHSANFTLGTEVGKVSGWSLSFSVTDGKLGVYLNLESVSHSPKEKSADQICVNCNYILQLGKAGDDFQPLIFHKNNRVFTALEGFGTPSMTTVKDLFARKNEFFPTNSLQIRLIITIVSDPINLATDSVGSELDLKLALSTCWKSKLESMFNCRKNADLIIRCGTRNFYCHKTIFAANLSEEKLQGIMANNVVKIKDKIEEINIHHIQEDILELLLQYMYTGELCPLKCASYTRLASLLQAVELLQVKDVKTIILRNIANDLDDDKLIFAYRIISVFGAEDDVKNKIVDYSRKRFEHLIKYPEFKLALEQSPDLILKF